MGNAAASEDKRPVVWTIGHSTRTIEEFIDMLKSFEIEVLIDVRHYPGSRRFPQFNKPELKESVEKDGIEYIHMEDLGGRRKPRPDSIHTEWRHEAFRGYADYMDTPRFKKAENDLEKGLRKSARHTSAPKPYGGAATGG